MQQIFSIFVLIYGLFTNHAFGKDLTLSRHKRQTERAPPPPEYIELLENFWPESSSRCPDGYMLCMDASYCFNQEQLCGGQDACTDSSDDINAICLGKERPPTTEGTTMTLTTTSRTTRTSRTTVTRSRTFVDSTLRNSDVIQTLGGASRKFQHPLVIAFISLVGTLIIYVAVATVCCVKHRWNSINPSPLASHAANSVTNA
ncbi:unnamed protein product [Clavelina lepadiformis]|uniref:Uncharacterized protein n=1 Tax=Clavelina lepadiformis TaxID=159417 RepID=A0ABP0G5S9_CLALP